MQSPSTLRSSSSQTSITMSKLPSIVVDSVINQLGMPGATKHVQDYPFNWRQWMYIMKLAMQRRVGLEIIILESCLLSPEYDRLIDGDILRLYNDFLNINQRAIRKIHEHVLQLIQKKRESVSGSGEEVREEAGEV